VEYEGELPIQVTSSLTLDPWQFVQPGWSDQIRGEPLSDGYRWGSATGLAVSAHSDGKTAFWSYNDGREFILSPEDPNFAYPAGHWLPFPCAVFESNGRLITLEVER